MTAIHFVGDCAAARPDPASIFAGVADRIGACDFLFGQLEAVLTDRGERVPNARLAMRSPPEFAQVLADIGFDAVSTAGNHCLDWGYAALEDTAAHLAAAGVGHSGTGRNLAQARRPALVRKGGTTVALLSYNAILPEGYAAERNRPGCAPLRAHTLHQAIEHDQPGTPAKTITKAWPSDLAMLRDDIVAAKNEADVVIVSVHWGLHMVEAEIADYQREFATAAADGGAAALFGHHPHILKGVEFCGAMPVFYSLGNFAIEQPQAFDPAIVESDSFRHLMSLNPASRPEDLYVLPPDTRMTGIARIELDGGSLTAARFLPAWIGDDSAPHLLSADDERHGQVADYLAAISRKAGLSLRVESDAAGLLLSPG